MRLIDADYITEGRVFNDPVVIAAECAPTIDAIPVVWLEARKTKYYEDWGLVPVSVGEALTMWQKEQEADIAQKLGVQPKEGTCTD